MWIGGAAILAKMAVLEAVFLKALQVPDPEGLVNAISSEITITVDSIVISWNDLIGGMREWLGDRVIKNLTNRKITCTPRHWERTIGIDKDHLNDDALGLAKDDMNGLARCAQMDQWVKAVARLETGVTDVGWDNLTVYNNAHLLSDGTAVDNLGGAAIDGAGALAAAITYFDNSKSMDGTPMRVVPDLVVAGPSSRAACETLFDQQFAAGGANNPYYKRFRYIIDPGVSGSHWHLLCTTGPVKPLRMIKRQGAEIKWNEPFERNEVDCGVDCRHDFLWTTWQLAYSGQP